MKKLILTAAATVLGLAASASAQQSGGASHSMAGHAGPMTMTQAQPEQCRMAAADMPKGAGETPAMPMTSPMSDAQKAYMDAMTTMHPPMMAGIHAKNPNVAFICGMIPHHQGAIDMAQIVLKYGDNAEAKRMAEKIIKDQGKEIKEMTAWLQKYAK